MQRSVNTPLLLRTEQSTHNRLAFPPEYHYTNTVNNLPSNTRRSLFQPAPSPARNGRAPEATIHALSHSRQLSRCCEPVTARVPAKLVLGLVLSVAVLSACGRNDVQVYRVAKEVQVAQATALPAGHPDMGTAASPTLKYKAPPGWEKVAPGEMRVASFRVAGQNGKQADVSVIPLPGLAGGDLDNVNRWRGQVGLKGVSQDELTKLAQAVEIGGQTGQLYDQAGEAAGPGDKTRILAAISRRGGEAWFFKMTGDDQLVAEQKPAFIDFLKSISFPAATTQPGLPPSHPPIGGTPGLPPSHPPIDGGSMAAQAAPAASSGQDKPTWTVPAGWQEVAGGQFLVAKFTISGADNAQAAVNVSMSAGDGGGLLANVNRWRGQLGLAPFTDADLAKQVQPLELSSGKATLTEMTGTDPRTGQKASVVAAIVPQAQQTWFYKLMGNAQVVEQQKEAFTKFVQTAKYHE